MDCGPEQPLSQPGPPQRGFTIAQGRGKTLLLAPAAPLTRSPVLYWNGIADMLEKFDYRGGDWITEQFGPTATSRGMAILHVAIHDALLLARRAPQGALPAVPGASWPGSGWPGSGWPGAGWPGSGWPGAGWPQGGAGWPTPGGCTDAHVIAGAAVTVLRALYPRQRALVAAALRAAPGNLRADAAGRCGTGHAGGGWGDGGFGLGAAVATAILQQRRDDGAARAQPAVYVYASAYGHHRPDPINPDQIIKQPGWGRVRRFIAAPMARQAPPPGYGLENFLDDPLYRDHFAEVYVAGADPSRAYVERTPEQQLIAVYYAYEDDDNVMIGSLVRHLTQIARLVILRYGDPADDVATARLLALYYSTMADAAITAWHYKLFYDLWRPVIGIREADRSLGPRARPGSAITPADPFWLPYGAPSTNHIGSKRFSPPFPSYPSGHSAIGAASLQVLRRAFGGDLGPDGRAPDALAFNAVSAELDGTARDPDGTLRVRYNRAFDSLYQVIFENALSRVWLGVHWRFDGTIATDDEIAAGDGLRVTGDAGEGAVGGVPLGIDVAEQAIEHFRPFSEWSGRPALYQPPDWPAGSPVLDPPFTKSVVELCPA